MLAVVFAVIFGAVYRPVLLIVPTVADQVTATFDVFETSAVNCSLAEEPIVTTGGVTVTPTAVEVATVSWNVCVPVTPPASMTCTSKLNVPLLLGVPAMVPELALRVTPGGRVPDMRLKVYGDEPPLTLNTELSATPTRAPLGRLPETFRALSAGDLLRPVHPVSGMNERERVTAATRTMIREVLA